MAHRLDRRAFVKTAGSVAIAGVLRPSSALADTETQLMAVSTPLALFAYKDVQLHEGPMRRQFDENHARFLNLDDDRMLKVYRQVAGLPAPGEDMGGWYDLDGFSLERNDFHGFIAGHSFGQYVSGLARAYAVTGDEATRKKINNLVKGYGDTNERGRARFETLMGLLPALSLRPDGAVQLAALRKAANADDTGAALDAAIEKMKALAPA